MAAYSNFSASVGSDPAFFWLTWASILCHAYITMSDRIRASTGQLRTNHHERPYQSALDDPQQKHTSSTYFAMVSHRALKRETPNPETTKAFDMPMQDGGFHELYCDSDQ